MRLLYEGRSLVSNNFILYTNKRIKMYNIIVGIVQAIDEIGKLVKKSFEYKGPFLYGLLY